MYFVFCIIHQPKLPKVDGAISGVPGSQNIYIDHIYQLQVDSVVGIVFPRSGIYGDESNNIHISS